jgi:hypothetical protein
MIGTRRVIIGSALVALALAGCASGDEPSTTVSAPSPTTTRSAFVTVGPATPPATPPASPDIAPAPARRPAREIAVSIRGGKVDPPPERVKVQQGEAVRLVVTSDVADEVHVHGYDLEVALPPGKPATLEFTADQPGLFEVETHETEKVLLQLQIE